MMTRLMNRGSYFSKVDNRTTLNSVLKKFKRRETEYREDVEIFLMLCMENHEYTAIDIDDVIEYVLDADVDDLREWFHEDLGIKDRNKFFSAFFKFATAYYASSRTGYYEENMFESIKIICDVVKRDEDDE